MNFAEYVNGFNVPEGELGVFWLGQAGFVFKTEKGQLVAVDPYLSDCCERYFGFKRLMSYILEPHELVFDQLLITHAHYDHFDPDSVPLLMDNGRTELIGALDTKEECERLHIVDNTTFLDVGEKKVCGDVTVEAVKCDHGEDTPYAIGLLITFGEKKVYIMGDTAFRPDWWDEKKLQNVDLLIMPINGAFGNLDSEQASLAVQQLKPDLAIPCHYWNFAEHWGDPSKFQAEMQKNAPKARYTLMRQGEGILI